MRWIVKQAGQEWRSVWFYVRGVTYELAWRERLPQLKFFVLHHLDYNLEVMNLINIYILSHVPQHAYNINISVDLGY